MPSTVNSLYLKLPLQVTQKLAWANPVGPPRSPTLLSHLPAGCREKCRVFSIRPPFLDSEIKIMSTAQIRKETKVTKIIKRREIPKFLESSRCFQSISPITDDNVNVSRLSFLTVTLLGPLDGESNRSLWVWTWIGP